MTSAEATFHTGDTVVYAMQGSGRIKNIVTRTTEGRQQGFYQIELEKTRVSAGTGRRRRRLWPPPCAVGLRGPASAPAVAASSLTASAAGTE